MNRAPDEVIIMIVELLEPPDLRQLTLVCKKWHAVIVWYFEARNTDFYKFLMTEVLQKFLPTYWALAGSAALWLLIFLKKKSLFWLPNDVDVFYIGFPLCAPLEDFDELGQWADSDAQPKDVIPFDLSHTDNYSSDRKNERKYSGRCNIKIQTIISPGLVSRKDADILTQFDLAFLNMAVQLNHDALTFWFSSQRKPSAYDVYDPKRVEKYKTRLSLTFEQMLVSARYWQKVKKIVFISTDLPSVT
jgi:hypothetical protein